MCAQQIYGPEAERNFYESQIIVLDTLEQCLNAVRHFFCYLLNCFLCVSNIYCWVISIAVQQPKDATSRLDEALLVKTLLPEICKVCTHSQKIFNTHLKSILFFSISVSLIA